jgi:DNA polymerase-3 subunit alpha
MTGSKDCVNYDATYLGPNGLPCTFDWSSEPIPLGKKGKPLKAKPIPKRCTKACRQYKPRVFDPSGIKPYTDEEIREKEVELLGVPVSSTPFDNIPEDVLEECFAADRLEQALLGHQYMLVGVITKVKKHQDRHGKNMAFVSFYAQNGDIDVTVFKDQWKAYERDLRLNKLAFALVYKNDRGYTLNQLQLI